MKAMTVTSLSQREAALHAPRPFGRLVAPHLSGLRAFLLPLGLLLAWQGLSSAGLFPDYLLPAPAAVYGELATLAAKGELVAHIDRKSTRLNSSHVRISYAVFCL